MQAAIATDPGAPEPWQVNQGKTGAVGAGIRAETGEKREAGGKKGVGKKWPRMNASSEARGGGFLLN
jgi:hypothetical protein